MNPNPAPTSAQLALVAEITMLSYQTVSAMVSADEQDVADAKWERTLTDLDNWEAVESETGDLKKVGSIEFFEGVADNARLNFRNKIRIRYEQSVLTSENGTEKSSEVISTLGWF